MAISATYSSSVFKTDNYLYETVSVDLKRVGESQFTIMILTRCAEIQCFGVDEYGKLILELDDWKTIKATDGIDVSRHKLTRMINSTTAMLATDYGVDDVPEDDELCVFMRAQLGAPFCSELSFDNILNPKTFEVFNDTLRHSLGDMKADEFLNYFRGKFRELPKKLNLADEVVREDVYQMWGVWA